MSLRVLLLSAALVGVSGLSGGVAVAAYQTSEQVDDGLTGQDGNHGGDHDHSVASRVVRVVSPWANPRVPAGRGNPVHGDASSPGAVSWPAPGSDACSRVRRERVDPTTNVRHRARCLERWVCGGERIDDVVSGDIAGEDASGRYAEFLDAVVGTSTSVGVGGVPDVNSVNDVVLERGLADPRGEGQIPVFYWCGRQTRGLSDVVVEALGSDSSRWPRLGWSTSVDVEYDIPALRDDVLIELIALLGLNEPELDAVPPIENGFTWVKWPTWFWVASAVDPVQVWDENDAQTLRIDMRAIVERVEWTLDGEPLLVCTLDQMLAYDEFIHDPVDDAPDCAHRFGEANAGGDLVATVFYRVEEKIRDRIEDKYSPYPDVAWAPHPDDPEPQLTTTVANYGVRELYAVNTPIEATDN